MYIVIFLFCRCKFISFHFISIDYLATSFESVLFLYGESLFCPDASGIKPGTPLQIWINFDPTMDNLLNPYPNFHGYTL